MNTSSLDESNNETCVRYVDSFPDLLSFHKANKRRYPYLLESVARGTPHSRFDILFAFPGETLELASGGDSAGQSILDQFDHQWAAARKAQRCYADIPFSGGWFVYLAYELAAVIEQGLELPEIQDNTPIAFFTRIPAAIIRDHQLKKTVLVAEHGNREMIEQMQSDLESQATGSGKSFSENDSGNESENLSIILHEDDERPYLRSVEKIKKYIVDGDVFQVNLSRLWQGAIPEDTDACDLYVSLRKNNPAPFAGLVSYKGMDIISSSPERLVKVRDGRIETRPIAGTRPRGKDKSSDSILSEELIADPKERAEHIMLIDLERNDLGRVCVPGSVRLNELMVVETYSHVHHIVSNVVGHLREGVSPGRVIQAVFPGGTITGCPKVRCMEILAELEGVARGAYTGSMGYINLDGSMDLNILIRTIVLNDKALKLRAGGGIVMDSVPDRELNETRTKARGMLKALGVSKNVVKGVRNT